MTVLPDGKREQTPGVVFTNPVHIRTKQHGDPYYGGLVRCFFALRLK